MPNIYKTKEELEAQAAEEAAMLRANLPAYARGSAEILIMCQDGFRFRASLRRGLPYRTDAWIEDRSENVSAFLGAVAHQLGIEESRGLIVQLSISPSSDGYVSYINLVEKEEAIQ